MKFVVRFDPSKKKPEDRIVDFLYPDPGPLPPIVDPENPDEPKDGGVEGPDEGHAQKQEVPKKSKNPLGVLYREDQR